MKQARYSVLLLVVALVSWWGGATYEKQQYSKIEAEESFKATWLCNYIASLSVSSSDKFKTQCLASQLKDHFDRTEH